MMPYFIQRFPSTWYCSKSLKWVFLRDDGVGSRQRLHSDPDCRALLTLGRESRLVEPSFT